MNLAVNVQELRRCVGKLIPDITQVRRTQKRIADCMYEHIGIGVPRKAIFIRDFHSANPQVAVLHEFMNIYTKANSNHIVNV